MKKEIKRKRPIFKVALEEYVGEIILPDDSDIIDYVEINDNELIGKDKYRVVFDTCTFKKTTFTSNEFVRAEFIDVIFENCDLSNNSFLSSTFIRCEFINCKLIGSHFVECFMNDILFKNTVARYLDIADCKIKTMELVDSSFEESSWFNNTIKTLRFEKTNLEKTTFYETSLKGVDLSSSRIVSLKIDQKSLKGSLIASWQAEDVCHLLGVIIK